jgi:hypothetical protein
MFRASSCPSSGVTTTAVAASGLPSELGDSSAVDRGRVGCDKLEKLLVDSVESMTMRGLANPKFIDIFLKIFKTR